MESHGSRILISTRNKDFTVGLCEYIGGGNQYQVALNAIPSLGTVTHVFSGYSHVFCCGYSGEIAVIRTADTTRRNNEKSIKNKRKNKNNLSGNNGKTLNLDENKIFSAPLILSKARKNHNYVPERDRVVAGCVRAIKGTEIDIIFTSSKANGVTMTIMNNGEETVSCYNKPFLEVHGSIKSMTVYGTNLYIACTDGVVVTIDLTAVLTAARTHTSKTVKSGSQLHKHIISKNIVFSEELGSRSMDSLESDGDERGRVRFDPTRGPLLSSMIVTCALGYLGLSGVDDLNDSSSYPDSDYGNEGYRGGRDHREVRGGRGGRGGGRGGRGGGRRVDNGSTMEGHILLIGGGDADPSVRIVRPVRSHGDGGRRDGTMGSAGRAGGEGKGGGGGSFSMQEVGVLKCHRRAVNLIAADAAGRCYFTASTEEMKICVWDALALSLISVFSDTPVNSMALGYDCLIVTSYTHPYIHVWRTDKTDTRRGSTYADPRPRRASVGRRSSDPSQYKFRVDGGGRIEVAKVPYFFSYYHNWVFL